MHSSFKRNATRALSVAEMTVRMLLPLPCNVLLLPWVVETPPNYSCTHCGKDGHSVDRCYQLHGYPPGKGRGGRGTTSGLGGRGGGRTPSGGSSAPGRGTGRGVGSATGGANAATNSNALGLTPDQMTRLLSMLDVSSSDKDTGSNGEASAHEWLIDSGASHHMTGLCHEDGDWTG
ncbi:hypothetical protein DM860_008730 [Cuscuta australis]|uniref:CCHC-type domain-containing protein n=1 Tax=Cuscuta australis TaxID=267555 RepID=A0A328D5B0_9ASTE|nr:hypothetical protein DM860_008730 [Cuscuta australis]